MKEDLAMVYVDMKNIDTIDLEKEAIVDYENLYHQNPKMYKKNVAIAYNNLGFSCLKFQKYDEAQIALKKARAMLIELSDGNGLKFEKDILAVQENIADLVDAKSKKE